MPLYGWKATASCQQAAYLLGFLKGWTLPCNLGCTSCSSSHLPAGRPRKLRLW